MADNWVDALDPDDRALVLRMGELATRLQTEQSDMKRKQGGITPTQLQQFVGQWLQGSNLGFRQTSVPDLLRGAAESWGDIVDGKGDTSEQEWAALVVMLAMHVGFIWAFDVYESVFEALDLMMQNAMTNAEQVQLIVRQRLVDKTEGGSDG